MKPIIAALALVFTGCSSGNDLDQAENQAHSDAKAAVEAAKKSVSKALEDGDAKSYDEAKVALGRADATLDRAEAIDAAR